MNDKINRNRDSKGEAHPNHKLTSKQVDYIRKSKIGRVALAKQFSVSGQTIYRIRKGESWKRS